MRTRSACAAGTPSAKIWPTSARIRRLANKVRERCERERVATLTRRAARLVDGVLKLRFDGQLGSYPRSQRSAWTRLTTHVSDALLARLEPPGTFGARSRAWSDGEFAARRVSSVADELPRGMRDVPVPAQKRPDIVSNSAEAAARRRADKPDGEMPSVDDWAATMRPQFVQVPERMVPADCSPAEVTQHMLDRVRGATAICLAIARARSLHHRSLTCIAQSYALSVLLRDAYSNDYAMLLGEMQYAFVVFLVGHSFAGFEQWKRLVVLLCQVRSL